MIAPETGHSYNPRPKDVEKLVDRVIDYETSKPVEVRERKIQPLKEVEIRHRNKKKRAAQLEAKTRQEQKEFRQQLHNFKKIRK